MSEEEDYMSDSFLLQTKSVRPGLRNTAQKRKDRAVEGGEGAPREKRVKRRENKDAQERMQQGLATPISATNKGFSLLCKMGYETGMGLGRTGEGRKAPIPVVMKQGRVGLGRERFVQEKVEREAEERTAWEVRRTEDFHQRKQETFSQRKIHSDLWKSQLACEQLDAKMGTHSPEVEWFWPLRSQVRQEVEGEEDEEEEEEELEPGEMLAVLTRYLRSTHFYCIWCGTAYDDAGDMESSCPGDTEQAHE